MYDENSKEKGITVIKRESESIESLLRRFKRKVNKSEILKEARDRMEYLKPSVAKRKKKTEARKRNERDHAKIEKDQIKRQKKIKKGEKKYENNPSS